MSEPKRIQRKRTKGWKMPANTVYVGRPTKWGNKCRVGSVDVGGVPMTAERAVKLYEFFFAARYGTFNEKTHCYHINYETLLEELRGKDLACWCPLDKPCHADVLLELANR